MHLNVYSNLSFGSELSWG